MFSVSENFTLFGCTFDFNEWHFCFELEQPNQYLNLYYFVQHHESPFFIAVFSYMKFLTRFYYSNTSQYDVYLLIHHNFEHYTV